MIQKDRSLEGLVNSGMDEYEPLMDFRNWLLELREDDRNRMDTRRDGTIKTKANGERVRGPFTMEVRRLILERLEELEEETGSSLISAMEKEFILDIWSRDEANYDAVDRLLAMAGANT